MSLASLEKRILQEGGQSGSKAPRRKRGPLVGEAGIQMWLESCELGQEAPAGPRLPILCLVWDRCKQPVNDKSLLASGLA